MTRRVHANNVRNLLDGILSDSATSIDIVSAADFPTPAAGEEVRATITSVNGLEIVSYTGKSTNTLTSVTRALEGTTAVEHADGSLISINTTKDSHDRKKDLETVETGITASTTQTQGQGLLTENINVISTCATTNDTVTLFAAVADYPQSCIVINNGAETLQVFPASGDDLGAGVDTATTITAGSYKKFTSIDNTTWQDESGGGGAVDSVNSQTGVVVLDADDIDDSATTNKFTTAGDITKLAGIEALADVTDETNVKAALDGATTTAVTPLADDKILLLDDSDSDNLKHALFSDFAGGGDWKLVGSAMASSDSTIDFTGLTSTYIAYQVIYTSVIPATDAVEFWCRVGTGATPTWISSSSYQWSYVYATAGAVNGFFESSGDTELLLVSGAGNSTGENVNGKLIIYNPSNAAIYKQLSWENSFFRSAGDHAFYNGGGSYMSATAVTALRFMMSSGNVLSGEFRLYGLKAS